MAVCSMAMVAGVIGVALVVKRWVFHRWFGGRGPWALAACGPGFHGGYGDGGEHGGWGHRRRGSGRFGGFGGGPGGSLWLRAIFARLDTTPGQEREIRAAIEELQQTAREAKGGLAGAREDLARAIGGEELDEVAVSEASGRADATAAVVKDAFTTALRKVHAVLDSNQRKRLAELVASGPSFGGRRWGGPYRDAQL
jgi:Spy/CpxP family protein refolding chaperone